MKKYLSIIVLLTCSLYLGVRFFSSPIVPAKQNNWNLFWNKHIDSLKINKKFEDTTSIRKETKPNAVIIFEPDTSFRKKVESESIITKVETFNGIPFIRPAKLEVTKIDSKGINIQSIYKVPILSKIIIDHDGRVKIKKRIALKIIVVTTITAITTYLTYKKLKNNKE